MEIRHTVILNNDDKKALKRVQDIIKTLEYNNIWTISDEEDTESYLTDDADFRIFIKILLNNPKIT